MKNKKLVMIGYRPGKKPRIKKRTDILIEKNDYADKDFPFTINGELSDDMFSSGMPF